ncbi:MAG: ABC transporter ATP-binding protein [Lentisphaerae bacterium]|nr:ABC transporter ATP-binding protein [Lentisphaerota bacterium]
MPAGPAIEVKGVGKKFRLYRDGTRTLKTAVLGRLNKSLVRDFWALRNVEFTVSGGETLGIIGVNGAGKSTLLSLVAGTMAPTEGTIVARGQIASLLELGTGFHPDLTGRENVFLYGAIMGLSRSQMKQRFDAIVDFAGIADFIDQPVKHYSSGMYVRLGFAVAVEVDPAVLLVDEVLSVGDTAFQDKCMRKMNEFRDRGKTMLVVSHDLPTIQKLSDRILLLHEGQVKGLGDPDEIVGRYGETRAAGETSTPRREWGTGELKITGVDLLNGAGQTTNTIRWGESLCIRIHFIAHSRIPDPVFGFAISDPQGKTVYGNNTQIEGLDIPCAEGEGTLSVQLDNVCLARGDYLLSLSCHSPDHGTNYHRLDYAYTLTCEHDKSTDGPCYFPCSWTVEP